MRVIAFVSEVSVIILATRGTSIPMVVIVTFVTMVTLITNVNIQFLATSVVVTMSTFATIITFVTKFVSVSWLLWLRERVRCVSLLGHFFSWRNSPQ
jgi:hypothetical protein